MAVRAGFRGIDTACQPKHDDEAAVGTALGQLLSSGVVTRDELFIQVPCCSPPDPVHHHAHPASVHQPPQHTRARTRTHSTQHATRSTRHTQHSTSAAVLPPPLWLLMSVLAVPLRLSTRSTGGRTPPECRMTKTPRSQAKSQVEQSLAVSLANLGLDRIDSLVLHSPLPTHEQTMEAWRYGGWSCRWSRPAAGHFQPVGAPQYHFASKPIYPGILRLHCPAAQSLEQLQRIHAAPSPPWYSSASTTPLTSNTECGSGVLLLGWFFR